MKSNKSIILGIVIILVVIFITTGCGFYNLVEAGEFKDHFGALGYSVSETETPIYEADTYLVATKSDVPFKIEYYEFDEEVEAKKVYKKYTDNTAHYITSDSKNTETTGAVFTKFVAVSTKEYIVVSRVKNTLIFIAGTNEYANEINELLKNIDY